MLQNLFSPEQAVEEAFREFRDAADVLLRLVALALGLEEDFFERMFFEEEREGGGDGKGKEGDGEDEEGDEENGTRKKRSKRKCLAMDFIRTLHYAPVASIPEEGKLGCGAHCD